MRRTGVRRTAFGGVAALAAGVLLSACSTTQLGAAALLGSQRISQAELSSQVSNLQNAAKPYGSQVQLPAAQMPGAVLNWLIDFQVENQAAANAGVSVTGAQVQTGVVQLDRELQQAASQYGFTNLNAFMLSNGIAPQMVNNVGRYLAQRQFRVHADGAGPRHDPHQLRANVVTVRDVVTIGVDSADRDRDSGALGSPLELRGQRQRRLAEGHPVEHGSRLRASGRGALSLLGLLDRFPVLVDLVRG